MLRCGQSIAEGVVRTGLAHPAVCMNGATRNGDDAGPTIKKGEKRLRADTALQRMPWERAGAATERGVSAVYLGDDRDAMVAEMRQEYPRAGSEVEPAGESLQRWSRDRCRAMEGKSHAMELPFLICKRPRLQAAGLAWNEAAFRAGRTRQVFAKSRGRWGKAKDVDVVWQSAGGESLQPRPRSIVDACPSLIREDVSLRVKAGGSSAGTPITGAGTRCQQTSLGRFRRKVR